MRPARLSLPIAIGALALAGCSEGPSEPQGNADPIFFEIANADGEVEGWMLGTIHALPPGTQWHTDAIDRAVDEADYLIVEVANLEDSSAIAKAFTQLATTPGQPELSTRVSPKMRPALADAVAQGDFSMSDFNSTETWGAALTLARVAATGDPASGADRAIIGEFSGREVREFEGAFDQLRIFDTLAEEDQRDLLEGVLIEIGMIDEQPDRLRKGWLAGDEAVLAQATRSGMMKDPELYDALLVTRNKRWSAMLDDYLTAPERPLVAVGAGHLVGPDSMRIMLEQRGYTVRRLHR